MQRKHLKFRFARTGSVLGALFFLAVSGAKIHADGPPSAPPKPTSGHAFTDSGKASFPSYWSGKYWDAQKGSSFWHSKRDERRTSANAGKKPQKPSANGSIRSRDRHRNGAAARK